MLCLAVSDTVWIALFTALPPTIVGLGAIVASVLAYLRGLENSKRVETVRQDIQTNTEKTEATADHLAKVDQHINGRLTQLIETKTLAATAEGEKKGALQERAKASEIKAAAAEGKAEGLREGISAVLPTIPEPPKESKP